MPLVSLPHTELDGPFLSANALHPDAVPVYPGLQALAQGIRAHLLTQYPDKHQKQLIYIESRKSFLDF